MLTPENVREAVKQYREAVLFESINNYYWMYTKALSDRRDAYLNEVVQLEVELDYIGTRCPHPSDCCELRTTPFGSYWSCRLCGKKDVQPTQCEKKDA
jgi:hypothetical protein